MRHFFFIPTIAVTPDIYREIHVWESDRTWNLYRTLPETIESVEENTHIRGFRITGIKEEMSQTLTTERDYKIPKNWGFSKSSFIYSVWDLFSHRVVNLVGCRFNSWLSPDDGRDQNRVFPRLYR